MLVIYTQDATYIKSDVIDAYETMVEVYGEKLANEAYDKLKDAPVGFSFRKNGGPLIKLVSKQDAVVIRQKEQEIGMLVE